VKERARERVVTLPGESVTTTTLALTKNV